LTGEERTKGAVAVCGLVESRQCFLCCRERRGEDSPKLKVSGVNYVET